MNKQMKYKQILLEFGSYAKYLLRDVIKTIEMSGFNSHYHVAIL